MDLITLALAFNKAKKYTDDTVTVTDVQKSDGTSVVSGGVATLPPGLIADIADIQTPDGISLVSGDTAIVPVKDIQVNGSTILDSDGIADLSIFNPDATLSTSGKAADAKVTGDKITSLENTANTVNENILKPVAETINIYDVDHNAVVQSNTQYTQGTVYLYGYTGDIVISTKGNQAASFQDESGVAGSGLHVYNSSGEDMQVSYGSTVSSTSGATRQGVVVTIPSGASYLTFKYRTHSSTKTLVSEVMVTKGSTIGDGTYVTYSSHYIILDTIEEGMKTIPVYVSPDGNDNNDGLSAANAVATFAKALEISNVIFAKRGVYNQSISISNRNNVRIIPYDNDDEYTVATPIRQKIEINGGDNILASDMSVNDSIYSVAYAGGYAFQSVFVNQTLEPVVSGTTYRANVFVNFDTIKRYKLKPVLSQALCEAESNTFFWDGTDLYCNISDSTFTSITVVTADNNIRINNCSDVLLQDVACKYTYTTAIQADDSTDIILQNCEASYCSVAMGIQFNNTDGKLIQCFATNNGYDGFNFHGFGTTELIDCTSICNFDDGCSHHEGCRSVITGGEFSGNVKAGIAPAYGATVNIYNIFAANNEHYGIGYLSTNNGHPAMQGIVGNCAMVGNPVGLAVQSLCTVTAIGCKYSSNVQDKEVSGTLNEY